MVDYLFDEDTLVEALESIKPVTAEPMDTLLEEPQALVVQPGLVSPPAVLAIPQYRWPVRRNDEGCTGFTTQSGPTGVNSSWHYVWNRTIHTKFYRPPIHAPVIWDDRCIFTDEDNQKLIAVDKQGQPAWSDRSFRYETEPVVSADGTVYVGAYLMNSSGQASGLLVALDGSTGQQKWPKMTRDRFAGLSALDISRNGRVLGVVRSGELYAIEPSTGTDWRTGGQLPNGLPRVGRGADVLAYEELAYTWSNAFASGIGNAIYISAFEEQSGAFVRTAPPIPAPGLEVPNGGLAMSPPVPAHGFGPRLVFTLGPYADLLCFQDAGLQNPAQVINVGQVIGRPSWRPIYIEQAPAIRSDGEIYVVGHDGNYAKNTLIALNPVGNLLWESPLTHAATTAPVVDGLGMIYVGTRKSIQCFDPGGSEVFSVGLHLICSDSLSMDDIGQLYFHDGGILCAIA
jgi:outer membrane protein assembly factor BamB